MVNLQNFVELELRQILQHGDTFDILLVQQNLNLVWLVHIPINCEELVMHLLVDKTNAQLKAPKLIAHLQ